MSYTMLAFCLEKVQLPSLFPVAIRAVASMRRTEALASVKFYQILSICIFFIRLIILEDFIRLISYNGPCVRLGCSFFLATALAISKVCLTGGKCAADISPALWCGVCVQEK